MKSRLLSAALAACVVLLATPASAQGVKIGILNDQSGVYADYGNPKGQIAINVEQLLRRYPDAGRLRFGVRAAPADVPESRTPPVNPLPDKVRDNEQLEFLIEFHRGSVAYQQSLIRRLDALKDRGQLDA